MKTLFYSTQNFEKEFLKVEEDKVVNSQKGNLVKSSFNYIPCPLNNFTADLAEGYDAISIATADDASALILERLAQLNVKKIAIRAAGYDNVDLKKAKELGFQVANVPDYSPNAIAELTIALMLNLARKIQKAEKQVKEHDFRLDNLVGFELHQKTIGIIGTGRIGSIVAKILNGFGANLIAYDIKENEELKEQTNIQYKTLQELCQQSDIITINTGLNEKTWHMISQTQIDQMKPSVMLINTGRGACLDTKAVLQALKEKKIASFGADVYEFEKGIFFQNLPNGKLKDNILEELIQLDNVMITPHQAFATEEAVTNISSDTYQCLENWSRKIPAENELNF